MKQIDWIQAYFELYRINLPQGYTIHIQTAQHESGKVTIYQTVSMLAATLDQLLRGKINLPSQFYKKINKIFRMEIKI